MKIATSSASFARALEAGLTQLEWLDACANELEVDGVVFDAAHFPRDDAEYLAQLKKACADLGLTVAGYYAADLFTPAGGARLETASALGAPVAIAPAARASDDPSAWSAFAEIAGARAREAKRLNVTLAIRARAGTACTNDADLRRLAKDVDSAWLRFAFDPAASDPESDDATRRKAAIAWHDVADLARFAAPGDDAAQTLCRRLARFRGFVVLDAEPVGFGDTAYHAAIERFAALRAAALVAR